MKNRQKGSQAESLAYSIRGGLEGMMHDLAGGDEVEADNMWNDPAVLGDVAGDRIYDACAMGINMKTEEGKVFVKKVTDHLIKISHEALAKAVKNIQERHGLV